MTVASLTATVLPLSIIRHTLWLSHRLSLSQRDVQEWLRQCGIVVSREKKAPVEDQVRPTADGGAPPPGAPDWAPGGFWMRCVSRSVASNTGCGGIVDGPPQLTCNPPPSRHARRKDFFERLLANDDVSDTVRTHKLWSCGAAMQDLPVLHSVEHREISSTRCKSSIEQSRRPTRKQQRSQHGFEKVRETQEFLALHARASNLHQHTRMTSAAHSKVERVGGLSDLA